MAVRRLAVLLAALLIAAPASARAADATLGVRLEDSSQLPAMTLSVTLPAQLLGGTTGEPTFRITENGVEAKVISAEGATDAARAPVDVVLVLDTSGSMKGAPLTDALAAARAFVNAMGPEDRTAIVTFAFEPSVRSEFTSEQPRLLSALDGIQASGETAVHDALVRAAGLVAKNAGRQTAIVLLSDGGDTVSVTSFQSALGALKVSGAAVYAVTLRSKEWDPRALNSLASQTGGRAVTAADSAQLLSIYEALSEEIRTQYLVTYQSLRPNTKDLEVLVTASLDGATAVGDLIAPNPLYATAASGPVLKPVSPSVFARIAAIMLTFLSVTLFAWGVSLLLQRRSTGLDRLEFYDQTVDGAADRSASPGTPAALQAKMQDAVGYVAGRWGFTRMMHSMLERAGWPIRPAEYIYLHLAGVLVVGLLGMLVSRSLVVSLLLALVAVILPLLLLENRIEKRRAAFEEQLPEVLNLLAGSLRAGWGFLQAVGLVAEQMAQPASGEFGRAQTEARLGLPVEQALDHMAARIGSPDFTWTVSAIAIQREVGGNLAEVLDIVAATMRERSELKRHINSLTAEGRLSGTILIVLPFIELAAVLIVNPRYMKSMFTATFGWVLAIVGALMLVVGWFWLRRATKVEI
ncbi:MAG: VWA domain-containing protein [Actinobacteria bacterium]|nr:MAG: VWA domain-containing protein [Actinomycetota bacterium]